MSAFTLKVQSAGSDQSVHRVPCTQAHSHTEKPMTCTTLASEPSACGCCPQVHNPGQILVKCEAWVVDLPSRHTWVPLASPTGRATSMGPRSLHPGLSMVDVSVAKCAPADGATGLIRPLGRARSSSPGRKCATARPRFQKRVARITQAATATPSPVLDAG